MNENNLQLPEPNTQGTVSVEEAIAQRRSRRQFKNQPLNREQISQLLWAAQGITDENKNFRSAPSAGALYPLEIYLVIGQNGATDLNYGLYHYQPNSHSLKKIDERDLKKDLFQACLSQEPINQAPLSLIITGVYQRTTQKYGQRGERYVHLEAGHAAENVYLQAESLNLGTVVIGAFDGQTIIQNLKLPENHKPIYIMPIGHPK